jgi:hypothetical protein
MSDRGAAHVRASTPSCMGRCSPTSIEALRPVHEHGKQKKGSQ